MTIRIQRRDLARQMRGNPSLKAKIDEAISDAYGNAILMACYETGLPKQTFAVLCPWSFAQMMDEDFWPEAWRREPPVARLAACLAGRTSVGAPTESGLRR